MATMQPPRSCVRRALTLIPTRARVIAIRDVCTTQNLTIAMTTARRRVPFQRPQRRRCVRRTLAAPPVFPRRAARAATMQPPRSCVRRALTLIPMRRLAIITRAVRTLSTTPTMAMTIVGGRAAIYLTRTLVRQNRAVTTSTTTTVDIVIWILLKCVLLHQRFR